MAAPDRLTFIDNPAVRTRPDGYATCIVDVARVLASWRDSLFSYEWLTSDGAVKALSDLREAEREKREAVENSLAAGAALEKPVLGIGLNENIEIGSGRAVFLTLAAMGAKTIPVHVPKSHEADFAAFRP